MIGKQLAQFKITAEVGRGAMGTVYRAEDTESNREVAIKVLPSVFSEDQERLDRFGREAKILASLDHPNIGAIYGVETLDGKTCLILQWVEGEALGSRLENGPLEVEEALLYSRQIADALSAAHQREVIHRDLKPGNIHLIDGRRVKVLDFGIAKLNVDDPESKMAQVMAETDSNAATVSPASVGFLGTPAYMSPEQAQGLMIDHRTDIWAFGCCLFEMLTGKPAYQAQTAADLVQAVQDGSPDWGLLPPETPSAVMTLLRRCLEKEAYRRLSNIGDIALTLEEVCHLGRSTPSATRPQNHSSEPRSVMPAWAMVLVILAVGAIGFSLWRSAPGESSLTTHELKTLAVLPFEVNDDDESLKLIAAGIVDELRRDLRQAGIDRGLAADQLTGKTVETDRKSLTSELGVDGLLVGSLMRTNGNLSAAVSIISGETGDVSWNTNLIESLPRVMVNDIAASVTRALDLEGNDGEPFQTGAIDRVDLATYTDYRRGIQELKTREPTFRAKALGHFESAIKRDSKFLPLYSELAALYVATPSWGGHSNTSAQGTQKAMDLLRDGVGRFPENNEIAVTRAFVQGLADNDWNPLQALFVNRERIKGEESAIVVCVEAYYAMLVEARYRESLKLLSTASETALDDVRLEISHAIALALSGAEEEALELNRSLIARFPDDWSLRLMLALNLKRLARNSSGESDLTEALAAAEAGVSDSRRSPASLCVLAEVHAARKDEQEVSALLNELKQQAANDQIVPSTWLARVEAERGNLKEAITRLEKAHDNKEGLLLLTHLRSPELLDALSSERDYWALVDQLGLPQLPLGHPFHEIEQQIRYRQMEIASGEIKALGIASFEQISGSSTEKRWLGETFRDGVVAQLKSTGFKSFSVKPIPGNLADRGRVIPVGVGNREIDHLLTGTYQITGDEIQVTATLVEVQTGKETSSLSQSGKLSALPRLVARLSLGLARQVVPELEIEEESLVATDGLPPAAFLAFREGVWAGRQPDRQHLTLAVERLTEAMRLSPDDVTPYLALARTIGDAAQWGGLRISQGQTFLQRDSLLRTAESKVPGAVAVTAEQGWQALVGHWAWSEAYHHLTRSRGTLRGLEGLAWYEAFVEGRFEDAEELLNDGLNQVPAQFDFLVARARFAEAEGDFSRAIETYDQLGSSRLTWRELAQLSKLCARIGQTERSETLATQFMEASDGVEWALVQLATVQGLNGQSSEAIQSLKRAREAGGEMGLPEVDYVYAYLAINQPEQALFALESGSLETSGWTLLQLRSEPLISALSEEPRYWALVEQLDFPPLPLQHAYYRKEQEIRYGRNAP